MVDEVLRGVTVGRTRFVAVDGHGGSGKTTLAALLAERWGASVVHTDDVASPEVPEDWWPLLVERVFEPVRAGATALSYPRSSWWESHHPEPVVDQPVAPVMVVEGVGSLRTELRPFLAFGAFVDTPRDVCLRRGVERDRGVDGLSDDDLRRTWEAWYDREDAYLVRHRPQEAADVVLDGTRPFEEQL